MTVPSQDRPEPIAILGYGNQGRAQALNLRDAGYPVIVGVREGQSFLRARAEGFSPVSFSQAVEGARWVKFLLPDHVIPQVYQGLQAQLAMAKPSIGFAHGYVFHFREIERLEGCAYYLLAPRAAGVVFRDRFENKEKVAGVLALEVPETERVALAKSLKKMARSMGIAPLVETSFEAETLCDLYGEQTVLVGGVMQLMEAAFNALVEEGLDPEMAFNECCYELKTIAELFLKHGPRAMVDKISPTAFFGGLTRGPRVLSAQLQAELKKIFQEIRSGQFSQEWKAEVAQSTPTLDQARERLAQSKWEAAFQAACTRTEETHGL